MNKEQRLLNEWLNELKRILPNYKEPRVYIEKEYDPEIEWTNEEKELSISFYEKEGISALKVWGKGKHIQMENKQLRNPQQVLPLWKWLWGKN